jgi:tetratricopeptide (TPR) repeat protein
MAGRHQDALQGADHQRKGYNGVREMIMTTRIRAAAPLAAAFLLAAATLPAASALFEKGSALFVQNKPAEARPLLEEALAEDPSNETVYLYLGVVYQQLGDPEKAITVLKRGLNIATLHKDLFLYNIGNNFFSRGEFTFAEESYTAAVTANARCPPATSTGPTADEAREVTARSPTTSCSCNSRPRTRSARRSRRWCSCSRSTSRSRRPSPRPRRSGRRP